MPRSSHDVPLRVAIIGCGTIGRKRADALRANDSFLGCFDVDQRAASNLAGLHGGRACASTEELLGLDPDVVVIATTHEALSLLAERALTAGAHVLVEKPAGLGTRQIDRLTGVAERSGRFVKVGFNHRFFPGIERAAAEVHSGRHGELMYLRASYGHGGRLGYHREWRAEPGRSGGGELVDQGMHLLDLVHWIAGPLPLHASLLRTNFWEMPVEDNAVLLLGAGDRRDGPWASLHASWTEWKNSFSLEVYCRNAKLRVEGLVHSYGPQTLRLYRMRPELGPPDLEEMTFPDVDGSWAAEWAHFAAAISGEVELLGTLGDARYAWKQIEEAYARSPFMTMRDAVGR